MNCYTPIDETVSIDDAPEIKDPEIIPRKDASNDLKKICPTPHKIRIIIDIEPQYSLNRQNYA